MRGRDYKLYGMIFGRNYTVTTLVMGDAESGKSSLIDRLNKDSFADSLLPTCGYNKYDQTLDMGAWIAKLRIWDAAGNKLFDPVVSRLFREHEIECVIVAVDLTIPDAISNLPSHIARAREHNPATPIMVVATKLDLESEFKFTYAKLESFCKEQNLVCMKSSAKTNFNVKEVFQKAAQIGINFQDKKKVNPVQASQAPASFIPGVSTLAESKSEKATPASSRSASLSNDGAATMKSKKYFENYLAWYKFNLFSWKGPQHTERAKAVLAVLERTDITAETKLNVVNNQLALLNQALPAVTVSEKVLAARWTTADQLKNSYKLKDATKKPEGAYYQELERIKAELEQEVLELSRTLMM